MTFFWIAGLLCLAYFFGIVLFTGHFQFTKLIWLLLAAASGICAMILSYMQEHGLQFPVWMLISGCAIILIAGIFFLFVEGFIFSGFFQTGRPGLDYIIVLGAKVNGIRPSRTLNYRIQKAYEYLILNKNTIAILSGGKGSDEGISEAECMKRELMKKGIPGNRLIPEDKSASTKENIMFSKLLFDFKRYHTGILTNDFHVYRAVKIGKRLGLKDCVGIAADSEVFLLPHHMLREFFALLKDTISESL